MLDFGIDANPGLNPNKIQDRFFPSWRPFSEME